MPAYESVRCTFIIGISSVVFNAGTSTAMLSNEVYRVVKELLCCYY